MLLWSVLSESEQNYPVYFDPVRICGNLRQVELSLERFRQKFADYLLGAEFKIMDVMKGYYEIGRPISLEVTF